MTTFWWCIAMWVGCSLSFGMGLIIHAEIARCSRQVYDIDFTRRGIGT